MLASPFHVFKHVDYKARPKLKLKFHGRFSYGIMLMAFKKTVAYSSENPPDKKLIVGRADGIVLRRVLTVYQATSAGSGFGPSNPGVTMFGLSMHPSHKIPLSWRAFTTAACTLSVT